MKTYPVSETFTSPQGEGTHTGTLMTFLRFAGCSVGRPFTQDERLLVPEFGILQPYQEKCTAWNGLSFACDTNYRRAETLSVEELLNRVEAPSVCLTGGEPLLHDLEPLVEALLAVHKYIHVETSGTIEIPPYMLDRTWVTISPKHGFKRRAILNADELKVLVGAQFDETEFLAEFSSYLDKVFLQPINEEHKIDFTNLNRCLELQKAYPTVRISTQMHKIWNVR